MNLAIKKIIFSLGALLRLVPILKLVRVIYINSLLGKVASTALERVFDPNNIRRRVKFGIADSKVVVKTNSECMFVLHLNEHIDWKTFVQREFDSRCLSILTKATANSKSSWTFIDVGANIGTVSVPIGKFCRVLAFEPQKDLAVRLTSHFELNKCIEYRVETLALTSPNLITGSHKGVLFKPLGNSGATSFTSTWNPSLVEPERLTVDLKTLDSYQEENEELFITDNYFLKADVEGAELSVLRGAEKFIKDYRPIIFMEFRFDLLPVGKREELINYIFELRDYSVNLLKGTELLSVANSKGFRMNHRKEGSRASDLLLVPLEKKPLLI